MFRVKFTQPTTPRKKICPPGGTSTVLFWENMQYYISEKNGQQYTTTTQLG